jgi:hypothetical protein
VRDYQRFLGVLGIAPAAEVDHLVGVVDVQCVFERLSSPVVDVVPGQFDDAEVDGLEQIQVLRNRNASLLPRMKG